MFEVYVMLTFVAKYWSMISEVYFKDFGIFEEFSFKNASNLNVVIGENDTGKTSLLKMLYSIARAWQEFSLRQTNASEKPDFKYILSEKLKNTFQPTGKGLSDLVHRRKEAKLTGELTFFEGDRNKQNIYFSISRDTKNGIDEVNSNIKPCPNPDEFNALFIPAKEVLTALNAISATRYRLFMDGFDDTYLDLINSLRIKTSKGRVASNLSQVSDRLEKLFGGEILQIEEDFIFRKKSKTEFSMSLTAEGVKKLGILTTLIRNRQLSKGTILFMDEPEAVLHPQAIRDLVKILYLLSKSGIQVFISTHSFFVLKQLELIARRENTTIMCCSLNKTEKGIDPIFSDMKFGMPSNPIIDVAIQIFEEEIELNLKR